MARTDIQKSIQETISKIVHLDVVASQLKTSQQDLEQQYSTLEKMDRELNKELIDITKLEGLSTRAIFHKILGNKEQKLEKERQEYLELTLKVEEVQKNIDLLEYEVNLLEAKMGDKSKLEQELVQLKSDRENEIIQSDPVLRQKMLTLSQDLELHYQHKKELEEAAEEGKICINLLNQVINQLQNVRSWGGPPGNRRGQMQRMVRRDAMDRARNLSYQVRHHLNLFRQELSDVGLQLSADIDERQFSDFTGFFFNNIITDWIMQQKLTQAMQSINMTKGEVSRLVNHIESQDLEIQAQISQLREDRERILTS
jgi:hypothetical protein